jgi:hypothetical protein
MCRRVLAAAIKPEAIDDGDGEEKKKEGRRWEKEKGRKREQGRSPVRPAPVFVFFSFLKA